MNSQRLGLMRQALARWHGSTVIATETGGLHR